MYEKSQIYTLNSGCFPEGFDRAAVKSGGTTYHGQMMLTGPDAAIEIQGNTIRPYMYGAQTDNPRFLALIENYEESILRETGKLRKTEADVVVFTGVWHHVDFAMEPRFEAYIVHVVSEDGAVRSTRYELETFDWDYPGEGFFKYPKGKETTAEKTVRQLRFWTEARTAYDDAFPSSGGLKPIQGMMWFPAGKYADTAPIVVIRAIGLKAFLEQLNGNWPAGSNEEIVQSGRVAFSQALARAKASGYLSDDLKQAHAHLEHHSEMLDKHSPVYDPGWVLRELAVTQFGSSEGALVLRGEPRVAATVSEIANSSLAKGVWMQSRRGDADPDEPTFFGFVDRHRLGRTREPMALLRPQDASSPESKNCRFATEWVPLDGDGTMMRYLAFGDEPKLSW